MSAWTEEAGLAGFNESPTSPVPGTSESTGFELLRVSVIMASGALAFAGTSSAEPGQVWEMVDSLESRATASGYIDGQWASNSPEDQRDITEVETTQRATSELRRLSGLTWEQLAELFDVSRRSVHFWASGQALSAGNEERLRQVLAVIRVMDRGSAASNRAALLEVRGEERALDLLREQRFEEAYRRLGTGAGRVTLDLPKLSKRALAEREPLPPDVLADAQEESIHRDPGRRRPARTSRGKRRGSS